MQLYGLVVTLFLTAKPLTVWHSTAKWQDWIVRMCTNLRVIGSIRRTKLDLLVKAIR